MLIAQERYWKAEYEKGARSLELALSEEASEEFGVTKGLRVIVPIEKWTKVMKNLIRDRKLLGGLLLEFANKKEDVDQLIDQTPLLYSLQTVARQASLNLIGEGVLELTPSQGD